MSIGSLFNAGSIGGSDPSLFEDILKNQDYSQVFGDTSAAFGGNTVDLFGGGGGWNFVEPGNSNTSDFSNIFSSPAPAGLNLSQGFNSPGNLFEPSKGLTFDPGSVNKLESILDDVARGGMPKDFVRTDVPSAGSRSRFPTGLVPSANPNPVRSRPASSGTPPQSTRPKPGTKEYYDWLLTKPGTRRMLDGISFLEGTHASGPYAKGDPNRSYGIVHGGGFIDPMSASTNLTDKTGAFGRYQLIPKTRGYVRQIAPPGAVNDWSPSAQDRAALILMDRRYKMSRDPRVRNMLDTLANSSDVMPPWEAFDALKMEFASIPGSPYGQVRKTRKDVEEFYRTQYPTYGSVSR